MKDLFGDIKDLRGAKYDLRGLMRGLGGLWEGKKDPPKCENNILKGIKRTTTAIRRVEILIS